MRRVLPVVCALLAGCATYHPQPIAPTQLAQQFEQRTLNSDDMHAYLVRELGHDVETWPLPRWNRELLTLAAWYYNPALDVVRAQWGTAKAGIDVAGAIPNPVLQLPFQWATPNPGPGPPFTTGPALDIPIETAGKRGYRVDQASHLSEAARLAIGNEAWKVRAQVRDALLTLYAARERSEFMSQKAEAEQQIVAMVTKRRSVGENAGPDVDAAMMTATQAQADLSAARSAELDARAQLAAAIGLPVTALDGVQFDLDGFDRAPVPPPAADAQRDAILHRADLLGSLNTRPLSRPCSSRSPSNIRTFTWGRATRTTPAPTRSHLASPALRCRSSTRTRAASLKRKRSARRPPPARPRSRTRS